MDPWDVLDFAKNQGMVVLRHSCIRIFSSPLSWSRLLFSIGVLLLLPSPLVSCRSSTLSLHSDWAKPRVTEKESRKEKGGHSQPACECEMEQHLPHAGAVLRSKPAVLGCAAHRSSSYCPAPLGDLKNRGFLKAL